ncbi:MAG: PrsW family intramembrane metalloprotease [Labilithrix sp.]|nr:PrsW family intramembrane metalloprotease [Labilithrix sp.]
MTATLRVLFLLGALMLALLGCASPPGSERVPGVLASALAGSDDVELTYEVDGMPRGPAGFGEDLRALVLRRLGAGHISADVTEDERRVRIVVDESHAARVDELVTWTGTLLLYEATPDVVLAPRHAPAFDGAPGSTGGGTGAVSSRLVARQEGDELWYEGSRADVLGAIEAWPIDRDHRVLAEPILGEPTPDREPPRWRTRVVKALPVAELGDGALVGWADGPSLRVRGAEGSPAASAIDDAKGRGATVIARGRVSLGPPTFVDPSALHLAFGGGAEAYARAQHERQLLTTPRLPPLRRVGAVGLPPNRPLAIACLVVPVLLSLAWLMFVRRFDRAHPEPMWLVASTFLLGALAVVPAGLAEAGLARASPWLDPSLVTFGGQPFAFPLAFVVFTVVVGLSEEGAKRLAAELAVRRREFDEPVDGIVYGIVASLGFAAAENIRYFAIGRLTAPLVIARCFMSIPAHMFFGALWGFALGAKLVDPKTRTWGWLVLAAACHGLFDALLSTEGASMLAVMLNVGLASAFVLLIRHALRHGVVTSAMRAIRPEDRALVRVGRPALFWTSAALLHVLAFGIFVLGAYWQLSRHRPSVTFVAGSSVMLALLGVAALGVSTTVPLDVAIDDYGVTFAGAARPWRKIRGFSVHRDRVELDCEGGPILLGPAPPPAIEAIAGELRKRLGGDGAERLLTLESRRDPEDVAGKAS